MASASTSSLSPQQSSNRARYHRSRRRSRPSQHMSVQLPARFQGISEDKELDHSARPVFQEKSLYGMIAQAEDFDKFKQRWQSNDCSDEDVGEQIDIEQIQSTPSHIVGEPNTSARRQERLAQSVLLRPHRKPRTEDLDDDHMSQSQFLPPKDEPTQAPPRPSSADLTSKRPMLDRRIQAESRLQRNLSGRSRKGKHAVDDQVPLSSSAKSPKTLANVIAEIFSFEEPEEVIAEFQCWYLQSVLLQGYLYITQKHVCFYAYLQKRAGVVLKSGHLSKRGKTNPRYNRYWFSLKGNVLSYYANAAQPYYPKGTIDLRYGISAEVVSDPAKDQNTYFTVVTDEQTYQFKADSAPSAQEWVKQLQKVIFRSHNEGDSVKISLPLERIVDVEANPVIGGSDTLKLRLVDSDAPFAVDEYLFTLFKHGGEVLSILKTLTLDNEVRKMFLEEQDAAERSTAPSTTRRVTTLASSDDQQSDMSASQILQSDSAFEPSALKAPKPQRMTTTSNVDKLRQERTSTITRTKSSEGSTTGKEKFAKTNADKTRSTQTNVRQAQQIPMRPAISSSASSTKSTQSTLQTAAAYVRDQGKLVSSILSGSPREYYDRFSGALAGGKRHYPGNDQLDPEDRIDDEDDMEVAEHERRFRHHFALPDTERLLAVFYTSLHRVLPQYGKIYIGTNWFCYRSLLYGTRTKIVIPIRDIDNVEKQRAFRIGYPGMILILRGHEELFFDFRSQGLRDDCVVTILRNLDALSNVEDLLMTEDERTLADEAAAEDQALREARQVKDDSDLDNSEAFMEQSIIFDDAASMLDFKPNDSLRIVCLTIGSRGDVQPYIALCKGLLAEGHRPKIATHIEFGDWVKSHGIDFVPVGGNPAELMKLCVELGMFTPQFLYETNYRFRTWLDELLMSSWEACKDADLIIESPSAMAGIHIAEALAVPYFRAFTMMWTRTRAYPHAFAALNPKFGGTYNLATYGIFENVFWQMTANQINRWRTTTLGIGSTSFAKLQQNKVPFLYNFSPSFIVPPLDYSDWVRVTGYWFLDEGSDWTPPAELLAFIQKARDDNMKLVYIGFGSIVVSDSKALTQSVIDAVIKADVRCILSKGWSDRLDAEDGHANVNDIPFPPCIYKIGAAPHDWLFKQVDAAVHHGGAGTTGASLRAGKPTIIKPFFGDQYFSASRVEDLGVGIRIDQISQNILGKALWIATHDDRMRKKARILGERIRAEDGVATAIKAIYRDLEYAKTLIKQKQVKPIAGGEELQEDEDAEESWTFVEADSDVETMPARSAAASPNTGTRQQSILYGRYNLGSLVARRAG